DRVLVARPAPHGGHRLRLGPVVVERVATALPLRAQNCLQDGHGTTVFTEDCYLGQVSSNVMNGHPLIQAHASDTSDSCPAGHCRTGPKVTDSTTHRGQRSKIPSTPRPQTPTYVRSGRHPPAHTRRPRPQRKR